MTPKSWPEHLRLVQSLAARELSLGTDATAALTVVLDRLDDLTVALRGVIGQTTITPTAMGILAIMVDVHYLRVARKAIDDVGG